MSSGRSGGFYSAMPQFEENITLANYSHYKIGGPARFFFNARTEQEVAWAVREAKKRGLKIFILSGGTNLLIGDSGFDGLIVRPEIKILRSKGTVLRVGAGVLMADLLDFAAKKSMKGLEWAGGLPGTLGGAIRGNAGCFGGEIKDVITSVRSLDMRTMKVIKRNAKQCRFSYRDSIFKKKQGKEIILDAVLRCGRGNKKEIFAAIREKIAHRKKNHPLEHPNIGSTFKNVALERFHKMGSRPYREAIAAGMATLAASTVRSSPIESVSWLSMRTSASTADAFKTIAAPPPV